MRSRFFQGAAILSITTFASYVTGLLRDRIFAQRFGTGIELDIYNASFIVPDLLLNVLVAGALSAAFIPIYTELFTKEEPEKANELANTVLHSAVGVVFLIGIFAALFMPLLTSFIAPGFSTAQKEILISTSRLMLISPLLIAASNTLGAMLISRQTFLPYGLSPILYNFGIIIGTFFAHELGVYALVLGTLLGATAHITIRWIGIRLTPFKYKRVLNFRDPNFIKILKLMIPKMVGHPVEQLTFLGFTRIATLLGAGTVTAISFARNFQSVPVSLFGISISVAIFPLLSAAAAKKDSHEFKRQFTVALRNIALLTIPSAIGLFFLSELPIQILLGGGKFDRESVLRTSQLLSIFALSIPTESLVHLLARSFYALKNTITPVVVSVIGLCISVGFAYYKSPTIGPIAIPYGFFLGSAIEVVILWFLLTKALPRSSHDAQ